MDQRTLRVLVMSCVVMGVSGYDNKLPALGCPPCHCNSTTRTMECFDVPYITKPTAFTQRVIMNRADFGKFDSDKFNNLTTIKVTELTLNSCTLTTDNPRTMFSPLSKLEILRLNRTFIIAEFLRLAFHGLRSTRIRELYLDDLDPAPLPCRFFDGLKSSQVKVVSLRKNSIRKLRFFDHEDIFDGVPHLETLIISENQIAAIDNGTFDGMKELKHLYLDFNKIEHLAPGAFHIPSLLTLSIANNYFKFSSLSNKETLFSRLRNLEVLNISENNLKGVSLEDLVVLFQSLSSLKVLKLGHSRLTALPARMFHSMKMLREIYLENNQIKTWEPQTFQGLEHLEVVFLNKNKIQTVTLNQVKFLSHYPGNTQMNLSDNPFSCSCSLVGFLKWLKIVASKPMINYPELYTCMSPIELSHTTIARALDNLTDCVPGMMNGTGRCHPCECREEDMVCDGSRDLLMNPVRFPNTSKITTKVIIKNVNFTSITSNMFRNWSGANIKHLAFWNCSFPKIQNDTFRNLRYVRTIEFSKLHISQESLATAMNSFGSENLTTLRFESFAMTKASSALATEMKKLDLKKLTISNCSMESFKTDAGYWKYARHLNYLNISFNHFKHIPANVFDGLSYLQTLDISANKVQGLDPAVFVLPNLTNLSLANNNLRLRDSDFEMFRNAPELRQIDLSGNDLANAEFQSLFRYQKNLQVLNINSANISSISVWMLAGHKHLQVLNLNHNRITRLVTNTAWTHTSLKDLDLSGNKLESISKNTLIRLSQLSRLNLGNNPFSCSCDIIDLFEWINTTNIILEDYPENYACASPTTLAGVLLSKLQRKDVCHTDSDVTWAPEVGLSVGVTLLVVVAVLVTVWAYRKEIWLSSVRFKARLQSQKVKQLLDDRTFW